MHLAIKICYVLNALFFAFVFGTLLYGAKDIPICNPNPIGLDGVFRVGLVIVGVWFLGYLTSKVEQKYGN